MKRSEHTFQFTMVYGSQAQGKVYDLAPDDVMYFRMVGGVPTEQE